MHQLKPGGSLGREGAGWWLISLVPCEKSHLSLPHSPAAAFSLGNSSSRAPSHPGSPTLEYCLCTPRQRGCGEVPHTALLLMWQCLCCWLSTDLGYRVYLLYWQFADHGGTSTSTVWLIWRCFSPTLAFFFLMQGRSDF